MRVEGDAGILAYLNRSDPGAAASAQFADTALHGSADSFGEDQLELSAAGIERQKRQREQDDSTVEKGRDGKPLDENEQEQARKMAQIERSVITHEMAHMTAGAGIIAGGPHYQYQNGPDGKRYIVGGEVDISVSPEDTPEATVRKMERVKSAALAPADPSSQDRAVASAAAQVQMQAQMELTRQRMESIGKSGEKALAANTVSSGLGSGHASGSETNTPALAGNPAAQSPAEEPPLPGETRRAEKFREPPQIGVPQPHTAREDVSEAQIGEQATEMTWLGIRTNGKNESAQALPQFQAAHAVFFGENETETRLNRWV